MAGYSGQGIHTQGGLSIWGKGRPKRYIGLGGQAPQADVFKNAKIGKTVSTNQR